MNTIPAFSPAFVSASLHQPSDTMLIDTTWQEPTAGVQLVGACMMPGSGPLTDHGTMQGDKRLIRTLR